MTLRLDGNAADKTTFLNMLRKCSGATVGLSPTGNVTISNANVPAGNKPFYDELKKMIDSNRTLTMKLKRNKRNITIDNFCQRAVDLTDLEGIPVTPPAGKPHATTRCEIMMHFFTEYNHALEKGHGFCSRTFRHAHKAGADGQKRHRAANGQGDAEVHYCRRIRRRIVISYCNGAKTIIRLTRNGARVLAVYYETAEVEPIDIPLPPIGPFYRKTKFVTSNKELNQLMTESSLVFVGKVLKIGKSEGFFSSSPGVSYQEVDYQVISQVKGFESVGGRIKIFHALVEQTPSVEGKKAQLSKKLFAKEKKLLVSADLIKDDDGMFRFECLDPFVGVVPVPKTFKQKFSKRA